MEQAEAVRGAGLEIKSRQIAFVAFMVSCLQRVAILEAPKRSFSPRPPLAWLGSTDSRLPWGAAAAENVLTSYVHSYIIHTYAHTYMHTYMHWHVRTHARTCMHT